jgi:hypothetical protein
MKKAMDRPALGDDLRAEYDFTGGVRGKYYEAMQAGYTITIHKADGLNRRQGSQATKGHGCFGAGCSIVLS